MKSARKGAKNRTRAAHEKRPQRREFPHAGGARKSARKAQKTAHGRRTKSASKDANSRTRAAHEKRQQRRKKPHAGSARQSARKGGRFDFLIYIF